MAAGAILLVSTLGEGTAGAQEAPPTFVNGDAKAAANLFDLKVQLTGSVGGDGGLAIGFGGGRALTQYQDTNAGAEGRALDYSLLSLLNWEPTPECPDIIPLFAKATLPPVTSAESITPGADASQLTRVKYAGFPGHGIDFGDQDAVAGPGTTARATTTAMVMDSGAIRLDNPRSESASRLVNGVREAVAISTASRLSVMGGAMTLFNPTWTAIAKSGAETEATATFTYSSALILGLPRPGGNDNDLKAFKGFVESTFSGLGLRLTLPQPTVTPGPNGTGTVSISPLMVGIQDMPIGAALLKPLLRAISPQIDEALANYLKDPCANPSAQLLADVATGLVGGRGGISFSAGGAEAMTDDIYYPPVNFDIAALPDPSASLAPVAALPTSSFGGPGSSSGSLGSSGSLSDPSSLAPLTTDTLPPTDPLPETTVDESEDTEERADGGVGMVPAVGRSRPGSTGGTAGWVTLVGLGAVAALVAADQLVMRRSRKKFAAPS